MISINRSKDDLKLNIRPDLAVVSDPFLFLGALAEVLAADAFSAFEEAGIFDQATASRFRTEILEVGGSRGNACVRRSHSSCPEPIL